MQSACINTFSQSTQVHYTYLIKKLAGLVGKLGVSFPEECDQILPGGPSDRMLGEAS